MASKPPSTPSSLGSDLVRRSLYLPFGVVAVYLTFFLALLAPAFQRHFIFLHAIRFPFFPAFDRPEAYGMAPLKTRPLALTTSDGERIGAWHVLPEIFYQSQLSGAVASEGWGEEVYARAMREYPTILYLHGNSMNRAAPWRIGAYSALTSRIDANVVAIDYRGFGDSSGTPSEHGLVLDAEAAYRWIRSQQGGEDHEAERRTVTLFGQSLGTGIASLLAGKLEQAAEPVDAVVLMAPYTDLKSLVKDFRLGGMLPLLAPIDWIPFNNYILDTFLQTHLNTLATLPQLTTPTASHRTSIVLLHAKDDPIIPAAHSHRLFDSLRAHSPREMVQHRSILNYATLKRIIPLTTQGKRNDVHTNRASVTFIETQFGGHNQLTEGALDLVRLALRLPSHLSPPSPSSPSTD